MWQVIGQEKAVDSFRRSLAEGRLSHAYLLVGPSQVGKMTLALNLAQALNCAGNDKPCGQCDVCVRIASGNHADVRVVRREDASEDGSASQRKTISIDQIREVQQSVHLKAYEGGWRVTIVDGVELMSEEAANALLKILEEPPPRTVFVLVGSDETALLPTIRSRCRKVDLPPLAAQTIREALMERGDVSSDMAELLARLSHGAAGWAISAIETPRVLEERTENLERLIALTEADITERFEFASELATLFGKNRLAVRRQLELWLTWWRDLVLLKTDARQWVTNMDRIEAIAEDAGKYSLDSIRVMIKSIQSAMAHLEQNANPRLALEVLMLNIPAPAVEHSVSSAVAR